MSRSTCSSLRPLTPRRLPRPAQRVCALVLLAVSVASGAACGERAAPTPDPRTAAITDSLIGPGTREGAWQGADARSTRTATLDGPRITQLDETAMFTDSTRAVRQFRFDSTGALQTARESRVQVLYGAKATPDTLTSIIELEWIADSLVRSGKRVNDADRLLQPYEVDNLRGHADELLRIARAGTSSRPPGQ